MPVRALVSSSRLSLIQGKGVFHVISLTLGPAAAGIGLTGLADNQVFVRFWSSPVHVPTLSTWTWECLLRLLANVDTSL